MIGYGGSGEISRRKATTGGFFMKAHICVDASGLVHTVIGTASNVAGVTLAPALVHGGRDRSLGDAGSAQIAPA